MNRLLMVCGGVVVCFLIVIVVDACGTSEARPTIVPLKAVYSCEDVLTEARSILMFGDGGAGVPPLHDLTATGGYAADAGVDVFTDPRIRARAALVCACRAREHRSSASARGTESDALVWGGGIATVAGGAMDGIAASGVDSTTQKTLVQAGIATLALGSAAFALNAALNLQKRSTAHTSAAEDQEMAAAVLADDTAGKGAWTQAWSSCIVAEGAESRERLEKPQEAFQSPADAGTTADDGAAGDSPKQKASETRVEDVAAALADGGS